VADFRAYLQLKNLSARTLAEYEKVLRSLFDHVGLGDTSPVRITAAQLREYLSSLQQNGLSAKTVSDRVVVIKRFFGFLLAEGYIQDDPSRRIPRPKVGQRLPKALTGEQTRALFAAMDEDSPHGRRDRMLFWLIYACGLRVDEAVHILIALGFCENGGFFLRSKNNGFAEFTDQTTRMENTEGARIR